MPGPRLLRFAAAAASALALLAPATAASAATGSIVIDQVNGQPGEVGLVTVQAEATSAITSFTVHLGTVLSLPSSDFTLTSGGPTDGIWTLNSVSLTASLSLGSYPVTVDAQDAGGDTISGVAAGNYAYLITPTVTMTATPASVSYTQPTTTLSGQVTGTYPDGTVKPLASHLVTIETANIYPAPTASTNSSGDYSITLTPNVLNPPLQYWAQVSGQDLMYPGNSPTVGLSDAIDPAQVSAKLSSPIADYGQSVTLSGIAQYESGGTWKPLTGARIEVSGTNFYTNQTIGPFTTTTDGSGAYSFQLPTEPSATWTATTASQYLTPTPGSAFLTVRLPTALSAIRVHYTPFAQVAVTGCLGLAAQASSLAGYAEPSESGLTLQYSAHAGGPWRSLGPADRSGAPGCKGGAMGFSGQVNAAALSGYYRVTFASQYLFEPSVSGIVRSATVATRIIGFQVLGHHRLTVSGTLQERAPRWRGLRRVQVLILIQPRGSSTWYWYKKVLTASAGSFKISFTNPVSGRWAALYAGNETHLACVSREIYVTAAATAVLRALGPAIRPSDLPAALSGEPASVPSAH